MKKSKTITQAYLPMPPKGSLIPYGFPLVTDMPIGKLREYLRLMYPGCLCVTQPYDGSRESVLA